MLPPVKEDEELQTSRTQTNAISSHTNTGDRQGDATGTLHDAADAPACSNDTNKNDTDQGATPLPDGTALPFAPETPDRRNKVIEKSYDGEESKQEMEFENGGHPSSAARPSLEPPHIENRLKGSNKIFDSSSSNTSSGNDTENEGSLNKSMNNENDGNLSTSEKDDDESRDSAESLEAAIRNRVFHVLLWKLMEKAFNGCMKKICEWLHKLYKWIKRCCNNKGTEDDAQNAVNSSEKFARYVLYQIV